MKLKILSIIYYLLSIIPIYAVGMVDRITPPRTADLPGNTFTGINVPYYAEAACQVGNSIYLGGIFPYLIKIDIPTGNATQFLGDLYSVNRLVPGNSVNCRQPARVGSIKYDGNTNRLFIAYHSGENVIAYYDFDTDYYDRFSGEAYMPGSVRGSASVARYSNPAWIDVQGNTLYVSDNYNNLLVGVYIPNQMSYVIMGQDGLSGTVTGSGLTTTGKIRPTGVCVESSNNTIFVISEGRYLVAVQPQYDRSWIVRDFGGGLLGMDITADDSTIYIAASNKIVKYVIATNTYSDYTTGGSGDNYTYFDSKVTTINCKFSGALDNVAVGEDGNLYLGDYSNRKFKKIDTVTSEVTVLAGYGHWSEGTQTQHTGWGSPAGYDYYGNTLFVSVGPARMIYKVYEDGTKEDVAGKPGIFGHTDGAYGVSVLGDLQDGEIAVTDGVPYFYFRDTGTFRRMNILNNNVSTIAGTFNSYGYAEGTGSAIKYSANSLGQMDIYGSVLYFSDFANFVIRKVDMNTWQSSLVAGSPGVSDWVMGKGLTSTVKLRFPMGLRVDHNEPDHIYFYDTYFGLACIDTSGDSVTAMNYVQGTGSLDIKYAPNGDRVFGFWSSVGSFGGLDLYNEMIGKLRRYFRATGPTGNGDDYYSLDRDGTSNNARATTQNFRLKYFPDKNRWMFDSNGRFHSLRYFDEEWEPTATITTTHTITQTTTVTPTVTYSASRTPTLPGSVTDTPTWTVTSTFTMSLTPTYTFTVTPTNCEVWGEKIAAVWGFDNTRADEMQGYLLTPVNAGGNFGDVLSAPFGTHYYYNNLGNSYEKIPAAPQAVLRAASKWTIEFHAWLPLKTAGTHALTMLSRGTNTEKNLLIRIFDSSTWSLGVVADIVYNGNRYVYPGEPAIYPPGAVANEWNRVTLSYDGSFVKLYINGIQAITSAAGMGNIFSNADADETFYTSTEFGNDYSSYTNQGMDQLIFYTDDAAGAEILKDNNCIPPTETETLTPSETSTSTITVTTTYTKTYTESCTPTATVTATFTFTNTPTITASITETITETATPTFTDSVTPTITSSVTPTVTESVTPTVTASITHTITDTVTHTYTITLTNTETVTQTVTPSVTETVTETVTPTITSSVTETVTTSITITYTFTDTPTITATSTTVPVLTPTPFVNIFLANSLFDGQGSIKLIVKLAIQANAKIFIYNMAGELVRKDYVTMQEGWNEYEWFARNDSGQKAARGLYLLRFKAGSIDKVMKIAVK